jgi:hypothetical protein
LNNSKDKRKTTLLQWATLAIALGPTDENGMAQLGLSARSAEAGELPRSSPARGSSADFVRPAVSGWGRRCQGASPGGGEPATAGRRRGGELQLRVHGAAVSSGGGRCGDGGARRWPATGGRPQQPKEAAGSVLRQLLAADGGSSAGLAWRRGTRGRCGVVGSSALGAMECGDKGAEERGERRAEWCRSADIMERGETVSPTDRQRDGVTHGAVAACVARGAEVVASRQRRREVAVAAAQLSCARDASIRAPLKRSLRLWAPVIFFI